MINDLRSLPWLLRRTGVPDAGAVARLDLLPTNVILSPDGPVVIDWTNVASGDGSFDAAMTFVLMSTFETSGVRDRVGQRVLVESFRSWRGRREVGRSLGPAAEYRLADENVTPGEAGAVRRILDR